MAKTKWQKPLIMQCPVCGTELHILNQKKVKCLCLNRFVVLGSGKDKQLIQLLEDESVDKNE